MLNLIKISQHILKHWIIYTGLVLLVTIAALVSIAGVTINDRQYLPGLKINNAFQDWFRKDDPGRVVYKEFQDLFGSDDSVVVAIDHGVVFTQATIDTIEILTRELEQLEGVEKVTSLYNIDEIRSEDDTVIVGSMFDQQPTSDLQAIQRRALANKLYRGNVVDSKGTVSAIWIRSMVDPGRANHQRKLTDDVYGVLQRNLADGQDYYVAGTAAVIAAEDKASTEEALLTYLLLSIILILVLYVCFKNLILVFAPLTVVSLAVIWVFGLYPLLGAEFNLLSSVVASMVLMIGVANAIHYVTRYQAQYRLNHDAQKASIQAFASVAKACFFAIVTTAVGFFSMGISKFLPISEFGFYSGIALLLAFVLLMLMLPIATAKLNAHSAIKSTEEKPTVALEALFIKIARFNRKHPFAVLLTALVALAISVMGMAKIEINTNFTEFFLEDHHYRQSVGFIDQNLEGSLGMEILLEGEPGSLKSPQLLTKIEALQSKLESYKEVTKTLSPVDYLKELNKALNENDQRYFVVPNSEQEVVQFAFLGEEVLTDFLDTLNYSYGRIHVRLLDLDSSEVLRVSNLIKSDIDELLGDSPITVSVTGIMELYSKSADYIVESQVYGLALALILVFGLVAFFVRSVPLALLVMLPNITPIILTFGLMGWFGIRLDFGTVVVASVALGLAVDDTIHFISGFRDYFDQYEDYDIAIEKTLLKVGPPMLITTLVLFCGFSVVMISSYLPLIYFGILAALTVSSALVADMFVLPCLLKLVKPLKPKNKTQQQAYAVAQLPD